VGAEVAGVAAPKRTPAGAAARSKKKKFSKISFMSILCGTMSSELTSLGVST